MFQSQIYLSHQTCSLLPWPSDCEKKGQVENGQCDLAVHCNVMQKYKDSSWYFVERASVLNTEIGFPLSCYHSQFYQKEVDIFDSRS